jgi:hypothetical protein
MDGMLNISCSLQQHTRQPMSYIGHGARNCDMFFWLARNSPSGARTFLARSLLLVHLHQCRLAARLTAIDRNAEQKSGDRNR